MDERNAAESGIEVDRDGEERKGNGQAEFDAAPAAADRKYVATNGLFWMAYVCIWGFGAVYLKGKGFSSTETGIITGAGRPDLCGFSAIAGGQDGKPAAACRCGRRSCSAWGQPVFVMCAACVPGQRRRWRWACLFLAVMALFQMNSAVAEFSWHGICEPWHTGELWSGQRGSSVCFARCHWHWDL